MLHRRSKKLPADKQKEKQTADIPDLPTPARPKIASFTSALLAMLEEHSVNKFTWWSKLKQKQRSPDPVFGFTVSSWRQCRAWGRTPRAWSYKEPGASSPLPRVIYKSCQRSCTPALSTALTPLTHLAPLSKTYLKLSSSCCLSPAGIVMLTKVPIQPEVSASGLQVELLILFTSVGCNCLYLP